MTVTRLGTTVVDTSLGERNTVGRSPCGLIR